MAKKKHLIETTAVKVKNIEAHPELADMAQKYLGDKVHFFMKGLNHYVVDARKILPAVKGIKVRPRKINMEYDIVIQTSADSDLHKLNIQLGKKIVYTDTVDDKKKYKKASEDLMNALVKLITERAREWNHSAHEKVAAEFKKLSDTGNIEGDYAGIPETAYHLCPGVSKSQLSFILSKTYAHLKHSEEEGRDVTPAMVFGTAFHSKVLTPKEYKKEVFVMPELNKQRKEEKIMANRLEMENAHKAIITQKEHELIVKMERKLTKHPVVGPILKEAINEIAFFWRNDLGTLSRGKVDGIIANPSDKLKKLLEQRIPGYSGQSIILDVKTDKDASPMAFSHTLYKRAYYVQAAYYLDAAKKIFDPADWIFIFIVVEKSGPCEVAFYPIDDGSVELGEKHFAEALEIHKEHEAKPDIWHGYDLTTQWIGVPGYAFKD